MLHPTLGVDEAAVTHTQTQMTKVQMNSILCFCGECPPPGNRSPRHRGTPSSPVRTMAADTTQTHSDFKLSDTTRRQATQTVGLYLARQDTPVGSLLPIVQPVNLGAGNTWPACHSVCINICACYLWADTLHTNVCIHTKHSIYLDFTSLLTYKYL